MVERSGPSVAEPIRVRLTGTDTIEYWLTGDIETDVVDVLPGVYHVTVARFLRYALLTVSVTDVDARHPGGLRFMLPETVDSGSGGVAGVKGASTILGVETEATVMGTGSMLDRSTVTTLLSPPLAAVHIGLENPKDHSGWEAASVWARLGGSSVELSRRSSHDGMAWFSAGGLAPGVYELRAETPSGERHIGVFELDSGTNRLVITQLPPLR